MYFKSQTEFHHIPYGYGYCNAAGLTVCEDEDGHAALDTKSSILSG